MYVVEANDSGARTRGSEGRGVEEERRKDSEAESKI